MDKRREPSLRSCIYFIPSPATAVSRREVGLGEAFGSRFKKEISFPDSVFARRCAGRMQGVAGGLGHDLILGENWRPLCHYEKGPRAPSPFPEAQSTLIYLFDERFLGL